MPIQCPGSIDVKLDVVVCPRCGAELELFTDEHKATCQRCGRTVFRDLSACIDWCPFARKCLEERQRQTGTSAMPGEE